MKRATLVKRMAPRQRKPRMHPAVVINDRTAVAARELQRVSSELEHARIEKQKEQASLEDLRMRNSAERKRLNDEVTRAESALSHAHSKLESARKQTTTTAKELKALTAKVRGAEGALKSAKRDQTLAEKAAKKRAKEEQKYAAAKRLTKLEQGKLRKMEMQLSQARTAYDNIVAQGDQLKGTHVQRAKRIEAAKKKLVFYGDRLAWLYQQKGVPLPQKVKELATLI